MVDRTKAYRDDAIVLRTYKLGEADRIIVMLTAEHGKVRAVAKGVRKTRSKFGSKLEPASHVAIQLYRGRGDLDTVTQVEAKENLSALRDDLDRLTTAISMLEAVDHIAQDREANPELFRMLAGALRTVAADNAPLTAAGFFWKLLALEGFAPMLDACVVCGRAEDLVAFDLDSGGVRCASDRLGRPVSADALDIIRLMLGGHLGAALQLPTSPAVVEVNTLAASAVEHHVERRLRSLTVLDR